MTRTLLLFLALFGNPIFSSGQVDSFELSTALGINEVGINKVLCMKDGYTILFHVEINKPMRVMVFDSLHKRVINSKQITRKFDLYTLSTSTFKGIYEINNEAVLFFEQQNSGRHSLIMLRFDAHKGKMVEEKIIAKSKSLAKQSKFFVMKHRREPGYKILVAQDVPQFKESDIHVYYYNAQHELYRDVPLEFDRSSYDYLNVTGAESQPEGVCVSLNLSNMVTNGTNTNLITKTTPTYNHYLHVFYIPDGATKPLLRKADLSTEIIPSYTNFSYNEFAGKINIMMLSNKDALYRNGIEMQPMSILANVLFTFDQNTLAGDYTWMHNKLANNTLATQTDTAATFIGLPLMLHTNRNGLSTLVSESYERFINAESNRRPIVMETFLGNICITKFDDDGKEIWGTVLPKTQYYKSYRLYYPSIDLAKKWQHQALFNDLPQQVYERQFVSTNIYNKGDNLYIIYNDCTSNLRNTVSSPGDTVFLSELSNAYYYKVNRKNEVTKSFLFGTPLNKEYKSSFIEGADFDEERGIYASVIRYKRSSYVSLRMAWAKLD